MLKEFLEKRRIYKLVKQNKKHLVLENIDGVSNCYSSYVFRCQNVGRITLTEHILITTHIISSYSVDINYVRIDGWYGFKLLMLLMREISRYNKEKRLKELSTIGR